MKNRSDSQKIGNVLVDSLLNGDVAALSYAISMVENNTSGASEILRLVQDGTGNVPVIGFTGPPGVGKSTLISAYISRLRRQQRRVAVVAVDPSSPVSGGAVLGDRFRMNTHAQDPDVFIRSLSARGHLGGLCASIYSVIDLIDAAGWDVILLETVGAGQSEVEVADIADINVVIQAPGLGDGIQAIKSGLLEIADIFVVNKADMPLADRTVSQLETMLNLDTTVNIRKTIVKTIATREKGIRELAGVIDKEISGLELTDRKLRSKKGIQKVVAREIAQQIELALSALEPLEMERICDVFMDGRLGMEEVIQKTMAAISAKAG